MDLNPELLLLIINRMGIWASSRSFHDLDFDLVLAKLFHILHPCQGVPNKMCLLYFRMMQHTADLEPVICQVSPLTWASTIFLRTGLEMKRLHLSYSQSSHKYHQALFSRVHLE